MGTRSPQVDAYIAKAAPFARPILEEIREAVHEGCPDVVETMKWSVPHFDHKGIMTGMAAFKQHVTWGFWKAQLMKDSKGFFAPLGDSGAGDAKITDRSELPPRKVMVQYVRDAARLNEEGIKAERKPKAAPKPVVVPEALATALKKNKAARATFEAFSPSHQREYAEWIAEARQESTRQKRIDTAIEWLSEGKARNWKYMK